MKTWMLVLLVLAGGLAATGPAWAVGVDVCVGRTCTGFHPLPTLIMDGPALGFDTPFGRVVIIPCI